MDFTQYLFKPKDHIYNESLSTMGRQFTDNFGLMFSATKTNDVAEYWNMFLDTKLKYFNENFVIKPGLRKKLLGWLRKIPNIFSGTHNDLDHLLSTVTYMGDLDSPSETVAANIVKQALLKDGRNGFTHSTCLYRLSDGKKEYILIFTFDDEEIYVCQTVTRYKFSDSSLNSNFKIVPVIQWDTVDPKEYIK